ncbi:MAG: glutamyl-tRNA reductase [Acidimicrobiales bacterium]
MTVVAIGLNHRTSPEDLLERMTLGSDGVIKLLVETAGSEVVNEAVVLATCNRTEVYVDAERFHDGFRDVRHAMGLVAGVAPERFDPYLYVHYHEEAVRHLFRVTAGLDSAVLGEHEILGQVRRAWASSHDETTTGPVLNLLFKRAVEAGKRVRTETGIGRSTLSLSQATVDLVAERRSTLEGATVLLVGTGEIGAGAATALAKSHQVDLIVANRTLARAETLVDGMTGRAVGLDAVPGLLASVDVVISATGAPDPIVDLDTLSRALDPGRRVVLVDLARPRDLPAGAERLAGVDVFDLEQVQAHANRGLEARMAHLDAAENLVAAEVDRYQSADSARSVGPLIGGLHGWADEVRTAELDRYAAKLVGMADADREVVEALSRTLVAKILHRPTVVLRDAAGTARGDRLAEAARELFEQP